MSFVASPLKYADAMSDPARIGMEITIKASEKPAVTDLRLLIIRRRQTQERCGTAGPTSISRNRAQPTKPVLSPGRCRGRADRIGTALFAFTALEQRVRLPDRSRRCGIVTPPLNEEALNAPGYHHPGHTAMLPALTGVKHSGDDAGVQQHARQHTAVRTCRDG